MLWVEGYWREFDLVGILEDNAEFLAVVGLVLVAV